MKIDEKTILIVIIVGILGFFLWKSRADRNKAASGNGSMGAAPDPIDTSDVRKIVKALGMKPVLESSVLERANWAVYCNNHYSDASRTDGEREWIDNLKKGAKSDHVTLQQEMVINALWGELNATDYDLYETYREAVLAM